MPPKRKVNSVNTSLRKHGAETQLNQEPDRLHDSSKPNTSSRLAPPEPARSDKTYPGAQPKRIIIQTYPAPPISNNIRSDYNEEEHTSDSSDEDESSSNSCNTEPSSTDTEKTSENEDDAYEPKSKVSKIQWPVSIPLGGMPMPEFSIDKDIEHYIADMSTYLGQYQQLPELQKAKLVITGVKGEARDVIMGYADKEVNTTRKIIKILKNEFKKREKSVRNLHQLKQEVNEKISIFAGRIRRYVRGLGVRTRRFDQTCIEFMKIGALPQIQGRLYQRNPKSFARAIKIAIEAEADKPNKLKSKIENINNVNIEIESKEEFQQTVKELNNIIQHLKQKPDAPHRGMVQQKNYSTFPIGNGVKGACFVCHKIGHRYMHCYNATPQQKQAITEQIETSKAQRRAKWDEKNRQSLNLLETTQDPLELSH